MNTDRVIIIHIPGRGKSRWRELYERAILEGMATARCVVDDVEYLNEVGSIDPEAWQRINLESFRGQTKTRAPGAGDDDEEKALHEMVLRAIERLKAEEESGTLHVGIDMAGKTDECIVFMYDDAVKIIDRINMRMPDLPPADIAPYEGGKRKAQWKRERNGRYGR